LCSLGPSDTKMFDHVNVGHSDTKMFDHLNFEHSDTKGCGAESEPFDCVIFGRSDAN
jgi:hypothetical protein